MKWRILGGIVLLGAVALVACSMRNTGQPTQSPTADMGRAATPATTPKAGNDLMPGGGSPTEAVATIEPLSDAEIAAFHHRIKDLSSDYRSRIEARRELLAGLLKRGPTDQILSELADMVGDVEKTDGEVMARRVAFSEANTWQANKQYEAAIVAYQLVQDRWPESDFASEALMHQGECHLGLTRYAEAEAVFQRFVEQYDSSQMAGWGWRKLALAQLLQSHFDEALATLDVMATKYNGTEFADYARARKGYVLMVAGKDQEARKAYEAFLSGCPTSKYCRLVEKQMQELDKWKTLARTGI